MRRVLDNISYWKVVLIISVLFICFQSTSYATQNVTLQWDANVETDLVGYKVYYKIGSSGGGILENYNGTGADEGDSGFKMPLAQDENPDPYIVEKTIHNLPDDVTFFFVVTAYDNEELESEASNEVSSLGVKSITSSTSNGTYKAGEDIDITVNFSEAVTLSGGNLVVTLDTGRTIDITPFNLQSAISSADSNSEYYTVQAGDNSTDLNVNSLDLDPPTATLKNADKLDCSLSIPTGANLADNKDIVVGTHELAPADSSDEGCFIATAAFGSKMDRHVKILTEFRDKRLLTNPIGHSIVDAYYKLSPPVASYLHNHPFARAVVRYALVPITGVAYISLSIHPLVLLFAFILLLLTGVYFFKRSAISTRQSAIRDWRHVKAFIDIFTTDKWRTQRYKTTIPFH